jgi:hypothetical protein
MCTSMLDDFSDHFRETEAICVDQIVFARWSKSVKYH